MMDFKGLCRRRRLHFLVPFTAVMALAVATALLLPAKYKSTAKILIEGVETPQTPGLPTLPTAQEDPLDSVKQIALTRGNLLSIALELGLYPDMAADTPDERIVERMRKDIEVTAVSSGTGGGMALGASAAPTAFTLSFVSKDPHMAAKACETLASLFLGENVKERESKALKSYHFLSQQLEDLQMEILDTEERIAKFKEEHLLSLPELMDLNLREMDNIQKEIEVQQIQLKTARDHKIFLEGQLAGIKPTIQPYTSDQGRVLTVEDQLKSLRSKYVSLKATHSDKHPDVIRLGREIAALESTMDDSDTLRIMVDQRDAARTRLAALRKRFAPAHPDVAAAEKEVRAAEAEIASYKERRAGVASQGVKPDNPAYINITTQIESSELEIRSVLDTIDKLRARYRDYVDRLERMPQVESEFLALQRHYLSLQGKHKEIFVRQQKARETMDMEQQQIGDHFTLLEPALVPTTPFKPNRMLLATLGFLLAVSVGLGTAVTAENLDDSAHAPGDLVQLTGLPMLGVVPRLVTRDEKRTTAKRRNIVATTLALLALGAFLAVVLARTLLDG